MFKWLFRDTITKECEHDWETVGTSMTFKDIVKELDVEMDLRYDEFNNNDVCSSFSFVYSDYGSLTVEYKGVRVGLVGKDWFFFDTVCLLCGECRMAIKDEKKRIKQYILTTYHKELKKKRDSEERKQLAKKLWDECPGRTKK